MRVWIYVTVAFVLGVMCGFQGGASAGYKQAALDYPAHHCTPWFADHKRTNDTGAALCQIN